MQLFECQSCGHVVYFENVVCVQCGHQLGYLPDIGRMSAVEPEGAQWIALAHPGARYRFCANWEQYACNWMVAADGASDFCTACQHNRTIPDISLPENQAKWRLIEAAKRRLFYSLIKLGLPMPTLASGDPEPLVFDFLADTPTGERAMTGHDGGVITIALAEADDATREHMRLQMGERYRTLLGHFRHEVGHYYWDRLVRDGGEMDSFRAMFGDERADYDEALSRHYRAGAPAGWQQAFVSSYASAHPWEDWAESWAHYLHIVDTLDMAGAFGIKVDAGVSNHPELGADIAFDPHQPGDMARLIDAWLPLTYAVNCLNRSMGLPDLYPFVLPPAVVGKLAYIHRLVHGEAPVWA